MNEKRECKLCEKEFWPKRHWQIFCSPGCRKEYYLEARRLAQDWSELVNKLRQAGHEEAADYVKNWLEVEY